MPQTYSCDICHEVAADFMVTNISDGRTVAVGVECLLDWAMPIAQAYMDAVDREAGQEAAQGAPGAAQGPEWEDGYPQGRDTEGAATEAVAAPEGEPTAEKAPPAHVRRRG